MADKLSTADNLQRLAQQYQAVIDAAAMLAQIGSLEQATKEAQAARDAATKEADKAKADLKKAKAGLDDVNAQAQAIIDKALAESNQIAANAVSGADAIKAEAKLSAESIVNKALADANALTATSRAEYRMLQDDIARAKDALDSAKAQCDAVTAQAVDAEKRLEQAKAKVKALID